MRVAVLATAVLLLGAVPLDAPPSSQDVLLWKAFSLDEIRDERRASGRPWKEFLQVPDLFMGLYELPARGRDRQMPHESDEVYFVLEGRATLLVAGDRTEVQPGSVIYVAKGQAHRFVDITEDLSLLVFFSTPQE